MKIEGEMKGKMKAIFEVLRAVDTPTICNALELVMGGRRAEGFTRSQMVCANPTLPPIVGFARTARIRAASPPLASADDVLKLRLDYYDYVASGCRPNIVVIEDTDERPIGGFWGEVNVAQHKGLGLAGTLTNGILRDLGSLDEGYQVIAGSIGPSHAFVHVTEIDCEVSIFGMRVKPDDIIHADRHGAVVIAVEYLDSLPAAIDKVIAKEKILLDAARAPDFSPQKLRQAWAQAAEMK